MTQNIARISMGGFSDCRSKMCALCCIENEIDKVYETRTKCLKLLLVGATQAIFIEYPLNNDSKTKTLHVLANNCKKYVLLL